MLDALGHPQTALPAPWRPLTLDARLELVLTGVGKANAAGAVARALSPRHAGVLSLGLAGSLPHPPGTPGLSVGGVVVAEACQFADDGLALADRFVPQSDLGFPAVEGPGECFPTDPAWRHALAPLADRLGPVATVSACSGSDAAAAEIARRTGAWCEDMESAAVGLVAARLVVPFGCIRVISNRTGDRADQGWDLDLAFSVLTRLARSLWAG